MTAFEAGRCRDKGSARCKAGGMFVHIFSRTAVVLTHYRNLIKVIVPACSGSPAIEFALLAPVMAILLTGSYDITQSLIALRQVTRAAQEIVEVATELSVQPDMSASLTAGQVYQAQTAIYALMPRLRSGRDVNKFSVTLSSVVFAPSSHGCIPGVDCSLTAYTAWSNALPQGIQTTRSCGVVAQVSATQQSTISNLPTAGIMTLTSVIVVDVSYIYQPLFVNFLTGPFTLRHTAFMTPRIGKATQYKPANTSSDHSLCPGSL